jgi:hypothetical protein
VKKSDVDDDGAASSWLVVVVMHTSSSCIVNQRVLLMTDFEKRGRTGKQNSGNGNLKF